MKWNTELYDKKHDFVSKFGEGILSYLQPKAGETILDLGCGTGDLTQEIFQKGARVIGVDNSAEMIQVAKTKFPSIEFFQADARIMNFDTPFDAIFSNAVLHWIKEKDLVIRQMHLSLKENGRIVLEFGGKGNIQQMENAMRMVLKRNGYDKNANIDFWYFPSIGEYATELEKQNFRVIHAEHFDRNTPLKGDRGMKDWFKMFGINFLNDVPEDEIEYILDEVDDILRPTHYRDGIWNADYKRIRIVAIKSK
ncbi:MAG TPA: methyltransferase domain-containing protein [Puia sp.]|jgi:trans-aconitate methyltransferase|nr:methyltransferase domain-containing protein [Puia sp.]